MTESIELIKEAFSTINGHSYPDIKGYQLFYVGGAVRDEIMGNPSHDIDLATNATPSGMITVCKVHGLNFRYTKNALLHGTITIEGIEVTTFRYDVSCDGRNATTEWATTIEEDLSRRDITINAIAKNVYTGEIVDPFNGLQDIKNKIIRAVGNPEDRLKEDTLRALRVIRFANRFGFKIEPSLLIAIMNTDISNLSVERIRDEFMKILETRGTYRLNFVLYKIIPELKVLSCLDGGDKHAETVDVHSFQTMKHIMKVSANPLKIFVALHHDIGKFYTKDDPERLFKAHEDIGAIKIKEIMERMKFPNNDIEYAEVIVKNHMRWHFYKSDSKEPTDKAIRHAIRDIPDKFNKEEIVVDLIQLTWADCQANLLNKPETFYDYVERKGIYSRAIEIIRKKPEIKAGSGLNFNGNDLIEMGFKPSPMFSLIMKHIEEKIFNEEIENKKETLKKYIMENYANKNN